MNQTKTSVAQNIFKIEISIICIEKIALTVSGCGVQGPGAREASSMAMLPSGPSPTVPMISKLNISSDMTSMLACMKEILNNLKVLTVTQGDLKAAQILL